MPEKWISARASAGVMACIALLATACTSVSVRPIESREPIKSVLIETNPKVWRSDFVDVLIAGFSRHGIATKVIEPNTPVGNAYVVRYTARQSWDMAMYMTDATIWIYRNDQEVGKAVYHLKGGGGLALNKWQGTAAKMDPVIDELLAGVNAAAASPGTGAALAAPVAGNTTATPGAGSPATSIDALCDMPSPVDKAECRGELALGMTTNEVLKRLGKPDEMSADGTVLRYGDRYLTLDEKSRLVGIAERTPAGK